MTLSEPGGPVRVGSVWADARRRAAARVVDSVAVAPLMLAGMMIAGLVSLSQNPGVIVGTPQPSGSSPGPLIALGLILPHAAYEIGWTLRRGATPGKRLAGLRVVEHPAGGGAEFGHALGRYIVLHSGAAAGLLGGLALADRPAGWILIAAGTGWWAAMGASALWHPHRRGWHDRLAGTAPAPHSDQPPSGLWLIAGLCLLAVGGLGALALYAALDGGAEPLDRYDPKSRREHSFPHARSPDGDACWVEDSKLSCDLASNGIRWDADEIRTKNLNYVHLGAGRLCAVTTDRRAACWAWDARNPPRRTQTPDNANLERLKGFGPIMCAETTESLSWDSHKRRVVCWTVDSQQPYAHAHHWLPFAGWWLDTQDGTARLCESDRHDGATNCVHPLRRSTR